MRGLVVLAALAPSVCACGGDKQTPVPAPAPSVAGPLSRPTGTPAIAVPPVAPAPTPPIAPPVATPPVGTPPPVAPPAPVDPGSWGEDVAGLGSGGGGLLGGGAPAGPMNGLTFDLRPLRTAAIGEETEDQPKDGDLTPWVLASGLSCGVLYKKTPAEAAFLLCADHLLAGPLTAMSDVEAALGQLEQEVSSRGAGATAAIAEIERTMRAKWSASCTGCRYRIYDSRGNHLRDE